MFHGLLSLLLASTLSLPGFGGSIDNTFDDSVLLSVSPVPQQEESYGEPSPTTAESILMMDVESHSSLFARGEHIQRPIASITKLMTAYIILEENDPNAIVTVSANAASTIGSSMQLVSGEQITVKDLLRGLLINSGNDAAYALAEYNAGSVSAFVEKMNERADLLGMINTKYENPTGLDASGAYSSAHDQALLATHLLGDDSIRIITSLSSLELTSTSGVTHQLTSTNLLLGQMGIKGLKTGRTANAGECLITLAEGANGQEVITVVLGSQNRFGDTKILVDWVFNAFSW
ncbi:MAG: D-alanyl-D-alanine carboxypeptidase (penicillin-binding protein 5/6) [Oceanicoccus sp.]|jgi:D-alanyl-D-alanine carboxypeptidase (penicillin-binding protein 5/6)